MHTSNRIGCTYLNARLLATEYFSPKNSVPPIAVETRPRHEPKLGIETETKDKYLYHRGINF